MAKFYLTTTLPYVNGKPHIGHALEFIQADVIARYHRLIEDEVYFNVGTDEHGLKVFEKAQSEGMEVQDYVDKYADYWKEFCNQFQISYDRFIRTTDDDHLKAAKKFWTTSLENGDIYKKHYEGLYCVGCEEFKTEKDLDENGNCPDHGKPPIKHSEENYFFRFSKYQQPLLDLYKNNKEFIKPVSKLTEMIKFVEKGLDDISISRQKENLPWGVPVPDDDDQVMYVWFDALVNYVASIGYESDHEKFKQWWPGIQLCGPDNNRFQSALWQAMLLSAGLENSEQILVHGTILGTDGTKMSKTKGNVVDPMEIYEKYGLEATRFYMIAGIPTYSDISFSFKQLESYYKSNLANEFGNLLNRIITLVKKKEVEVDEKKTEEFFRKIADEYHEKYHNLMLENNLSEAMAKVQEIGEYGNKYITEKEPWGKEKTKEEVSTVLNNLVYLMKIMIKCYEPVIPDSCKKAGESLEKLENVILFRPFE